MKTSDIKIIDCDYHRNGMGGEGFYAVLFKYQKHNMIGIIFEALTHTAILDIDKAHEGNIRFFENSWRGDEFSEPLRAAIAVFLTKNDKPGLFE